MRPRRGDDGNAVVEFTYLAVLLMVPLVYVMVGLLQVQRTSFGVTEAARQAGRTLARSAECDAGLQRARVAAALALSDQGVEQGWRLTTPSGCSLEPGSAVTVRVAAVVRLPLVGGLFASDRGGIPVSGTHTAVVDRFREDP